MWVLIGLLTVNSGAGAFSQEFTSRQACESAANEIRNVFYLTNRDFLICVEK